MVGFRGVSGVLLVCEVDLDVMCRFVFVGWVFDGVCLVDGLVLL